MASLRDNIEQPLGKLGLTWAQLTDEQVECLKGISQIGEDQFIVLPTGSGKSLLFQLAPFLTTQTEPTLVLIVMPLTKLIDQQVSRMKEAGFNCCAIRGRRDAEGVLRSDDVTHAFLGPEELAAYILPAAETNSTHRISHLFVDESHCVANWGQQESKATKAFRACYSQISDFRVDNPTTSFVALTATATAMVEKDTCRLLQMSRYKTVRRSPEKLNLRYSVVRTGEGLEKNFGWLKEELIEGTCVKTIIFFSQSGHAGIAYRHIAKECPDQKKNIMMFHAALSDQGKEFVMDNFCTSVETDLRCIFATSAFSMGMDIPDIRRVVHYGAPCDMDQYIQETGRAGRDGQLSQCIILYHRFALAGKTSKEVKDYMNIDKSSCRRVALMSCYNITPNQSGFISCCDNCFSCCSCASNTACSHTGQTCFCVRWCETLSSIERCYTPTATEGLQVRSRIDNCDVEAFINDIHGLNQCFRTLPNNVSTIYPQLVQLLVSDHELIADANDIFNLGAYSMTDAHALFEILERYTDLLDLDQSMSIINLSDTEF